MSTYKIILAFVAVFSLLYGATVLAQTQVYLDFDDDDDPWTIRAELPPGEISGIVRVILEIDETVPSGQSISGSFDEGCCAISFEEVYTGTWGYAHISSEYLALNPPCMEWLINPLPCPGPQHGFRCYFKDNLPFETEQRYFIGDGFWEAFCQPQPCEAPTEFSYTFAIGGNEAGDGTMTFICENGHTPNTNSSWGKIKSLYE